jgi:hypothetical protein
MTPLAAFFRDSQRARKVTPGANDCLIWAADWVILIGHPDPAAPYRGRYRSWRGARGFVREAGGMLAITEAGARRAGLTRIDPADAIGGDLGLGFMGESLWPGEPSVLIRAGAYWGALTGRCGVVIGAPDALMAAWRV